MERMLEAHMDDADHTPPPEAAARGRPPYPVHMAAAAVEPAETDRAVAGLGDAGFARDRIYVVNAADVPDRDEPIGGSGVRGILTRFGLSLGDDLDAAQLARGELEAGYALILVEIHGDTEQARAHDVLRRHGGHDMRYYGRWTVTTLERDQ
jgi:hypothetical protein